MKPRWLVPLVSVITMTLAPQSARAEGDHECMASVSADAGHEPATEQRLSSQPTLVYLNPYGGRVHAGNEDSARSRSEVVWMRGHSAVDVPAWTRGETQWNDLVDCVQARFSNFDVQIVDEKPRSSTYVMAMVGGRPGMLGLGRSVGGIAPYNGRVIDDAVVFVFEQNISGQRSRCEATAHEIGHALGLDHSTECSDVMSYGSCGPKEFIDESAVCGEYSGRTCSNGRREQNSSALLARNVGLREVPTTPRPTPPVVSTDRPSARSPGRSRARPPARSPGIARRLPRADGNRSQGPRVQIASAPRTQRGDSRYVVELRARDADGIARVELFWTDGQAAYRLQCGRDHGRLPVTCSRRGDRYTFALDVGHGDRAFAVRVTDGTGVASVTKPRAVRLY